MGMFRVQTKAFGAIDVDERQKILFPYGILGFESLKSYVLLDAAQPPFYWLQSLESPQIAFVLIEPRLFRPDFVLEVNPEELAEIDIHSPAEALVFAIVTVPEDPRLMTANLQGPIVINRERRIARQLISIDARWQLRHPILEELALARKR